MKREPGLFDVDARLRELSKGDDLERMNALVDFEAFRCELEQAVPRADRSKGGRPPYDHVLMFRILILQASHSRLGTVATQGANLAGIPGWPASRVDHSAVAPVAAASEDSNQPRTPDRPAS